MISLRRRQLENSSFTVEELEKEARRAKNAAKELALELSVRREKEAKHFETMLRERAMPLGMKNLSTKVKITHGELTPDGSSSTVNELFSSSSSFVRRLSRSSISSVMELT